VISELAADNPPCPIIVKMHVSTRREEKRRKSQSGQNNDTDEKNTCENVVRGLEVERDEELTRGHDIGSITK